MYSGKTLHILNGDDTRDVFRRTALKDEQLVWREMLCEGPVTGHLHDPAFWKRREEYMCVSCNEKPESYFDKVIMEQIWLEAFVDDYSEIVLWFEHDLFCQVNLIALLSLLSQRDLRGKNLYTVSIDSHPEMENFRGYGQLAPRQLHQLLNQKTELGKSDLQFARQVWEAYAADDPRELEAIAAETPKAFPFLAKAIKLHLQRLPFTGSGLSLIDKKILEMAASESLTKHEVMRKMLEWDPGFGFTDLQYLALIQRLKPLLHIGDTIVPNTLGLQVLEGKLAFDPKLMEPYQVGGVSPEYNWSAELEQVVKVTH